MRSSGRRRIAAFGLVLAAACGRDEPTAQPDPGSARAGFWVPRDGAGDEPFLALHEETLGFLSVEPRLRLAVWRDGRGIWSAAEGGWGPPYLRGGVRAEELEAAVQRLVRAFEPFADRSADGPTREHESHAVFKLAAAGRVLTSWVDADPDERDASTPVDVRDLWLEIATVVEALIPSHGEPCKDYELSLEFEPWPVDEAPDTRPAPVSSMQIRDGSGRVPVLSALGEQMGWGTEQALHFAVWSDGRAIWSESPARGGPPYLQGRVNPAALAAALDSMLACVARRPVELLRRTRLHRYNVTLGVRQGDRVFEISAHAKRDQDGAHPRISRPDDVPGDAFDALWNELWETAVALVPGESRPCGERPFEFFESRDVAREPR